MEFLNLKIKKNKLYKIINIKKKNIDKVGIKNFFQPLIFDNKKKIQKTISIWNINVFLRKFYRGIHISRILNIINKFNNIPFNFKSIYIINKFLVKYLKSNRNNIQLSFIYFLKKISPISKYKCYLNYKITYFFKMNDIEILKFIKIKIPVNTLCPCSKLISKNNAHNQRSYIFVIINIKNYNFIIKNLINLIENESSSQIWNIIKRKDEKYVTEFSYNNPKFIEDLIRNLYKKLLNLKFIKSFFIKIENFESIHNYNVYSIINNEFK